MVVVVCGGGGWWYMLVVCGGGGGWRWWVAEVVRGADFNSKNLYFLVPLILGVYP